VFTARYDLSSYIKQKHFVFKGLNNKEIISDGVYTFLIIENILLGTTIKHVLTTGSDIMAVP
jgi:hypothetical protein